MYSTKLPYPSYVPSFASHFRALIHFRSEPICIASVTIDIQYLSHSCKQWIIFGGVCSILGLLSVASSFLHVWLTLTLSHRLMLCHLPVFSALRVWAISGRRLLPFFVVYVPSLFIPSINIVSSTTDRFSSVS